MKKYFIAALAAVAVMTSSAADIKQTVKDLEKSFKGTENMETFNQNVEANKSVFNDPEMSKIFEIYLVPGDIAWKMYDKMYMNQSIGQQVNPQEMAGALENGFDYYNKALAAGPYTDAKGKEKAPDSKKLINTLAGHYNDLSNVGSLLWDAKDYAGAYRMWTKYVEAMQNPDYRASLKNAAPADSTIAYGYYLKGLAAWQSDQLDQALDAFQSAIELGYQKPEVYDYALQVANQAQNPEKRFYYAKQGLDKFGTSNPNFLLLTLNGYIEQEKYPEARALLDEAIAKDPSNPVYFFSMGILEDNLKNTDAAIAAMEKAIQLNPEYAVAYFNLGRIVAEKYDALDGQASNMSTNEYNRYKETTLVPLLHQAAQAFEKAYELDPENQSGALRYLKNIYYVLNDETNLNRIESMF